MRSEGTAFFSLLRNVGSSIGISVVQILLTRNLQTVHAELGAHVTSWHFAESSPAALVALNREISRQAAMVAYIDDFWLMLILSLGAIPLMLLFRSPKNEAGASTHVTLPD
jgi:DHA2 family multidrug resistance protein